MKFLTLQCNQISKSFEQEGIQKKIFDNITAQFHKGKTYGISGASGSGKSTFLHILAGLEKHSSGSFQIETSTGTHSFENLSERARLHAYGIVFQVPHLIYQLSVLENVIIKGMMTGMSSLQAHKEAKELLCAMKLESYLHVMPTVLSGGQQQRVALARALIAKPDFLFADELTSALDEPMAKEILDLVLYYQKEYQTGLIIASHDPMILNAMQLRYKLKDGQLNCFESKEIMQ